MEIEKESITHKDSLGKFKFYLKVYVDKSANSKVIKDKYVIESKMAESTFSNIY